MADNKQLRSYRLDRYTIGRLAMLSQILQINQTQIITNAISDYFERLTGLSGADAITTLMDADAIDEGEG